MYSISDLAYLSGIKAHTIRMWERRYGILVPKRTSTNIRYYTDNELIKILNVATLLNNGWRISKVSTLDEQELKQEVQRTLNAGDQEMEVHINELLRQSVEYDEMGFDRTLSYNFLKYGPRKTILELVYPFMEKVGVLWQISGVNPAQEHFASNIIRRKILTMIDGLPAIKRHRPLFLLFLPENELHEIALIVSDYIIRHSEMMTTFLGANVPYDNLLHAFKITDPDALLTFFTTKRSSKDILAYINKLAGEIEDKELFVCGSAIIPIADQLPPQVKFLNSIEALDNLLENYDPASGSSPDPQAER